MRRRTLFAGAVAFSLLSGCTVLGPDREVASTPAKAVIVLDAPLAPQWHRLVRVSGAWARLGTMDDLDGRTAVVAPTGAVLGRGRQTVAAWVRSGGRLVTADPALLDALHIRRAAPVRVSGAVDGSLGPRATWATGQNVAPLLPADGSRTLFRGDGDAALATTYRVSKGAVLALAVDPVGDSRVGHELLPGLGRALVAFTGALRGPRRHASEVYLDPGGLHGGASGTPEQLADRLVGVRAVHVAGWNHDFNNPADNYDYDALIRALHARGILAYAWLEPPFVSLRMWDAHPECRQKTATGRDAHVDWRLLIALEDSACFEQAWSVWERLLTSYDWDGVNVAELYLEPDVPRDSYTPFSAAALKQFGGDPDADPEGFATFRTALVTGLTRKLLRTLNGLPFANRLELQVTVIDDVLDPGFAARLGSSVGQLAAVAAEAGAALQVEDPFTVWADSPLRYTKLGKAAQRRTVPGAALVDLNVVERSGARPTSAMTGAELDLAAGAAAATTGRVAYYALGTLSRPDLDQLPTAQAGSVDTQDERISTPWMVTLPPPGDDYGRLLVDGKRWPTSPRGAIIPAGDHTVSWSAGDADGPGLVSLTGEIGTAEGRDDGLSFTYSARARAYAVVTSQVRSLTLDGALAPVVQTRNPRGGWTLSLPKGTHRVLVQI